MPKACGERPGEQRKITRGFGRGSARGYRLKVWWTSRKNVRFALETREALGITGHGRQGHRKLSGQSGSLDPIRASHKPAGRAPCVHKPDTSGTSRGRAGTIVGHGVARKMAHRESGAQGPWFLLSGRNRVLQTRCPSRVHVTSLLPAAHGLLDCPVWPHLYLYLRHGWERVNRRGAEADKEALKEDGSGECLLLDAAPHRWCDRHPAWNVCNCVERTLLHV